MRRVVAALLLAATSLSPALAASRHAEDAKVARMADRLNDPHMQSALAGMITAMADMMMDLRIDKFRDAVGRVDPDARVSDDLGDAHTLGDVMRRSDPHFREHLSDRSRQAVGMMGGMAGSMAEMLPELRGMAEKMGSRMDRAMRRLPAD